VYFRPAQDDVLLPPRHGTLIERRWLNTKERSIFAEIGMKVG
jgi:hypothetical protein